jgi:DNA-binding NtrC family response regulator
MPIKDLEQTLDKKIRPVLDKAMQDYLGVNVKNIETDISDELKKNPLLEISVNTSLNYKDAKKEFKKAYISHLLRLNFGNVSEVARIAHIDRRSIHRMISEFKVKIDDFRKDLFRAEYIKKMEVKNIIENVLDNYKKIIQPDKLEALYNKAPELSADIVKELPENPMSLKDAEDYFDKKYLRKKLKENDWNISKTARNIGLRFETLFRKIKKLGIDPK